MTNSISSFTLLKRILRAKYVIRALGIPTMKVVYVTHPEYCPVACFTFKSDSWPYEDTPTTKLQSGDLAMQLEIHPGLCHTPRSKEEADDEKSEPVLFKYLEPSNCLLLQVAGCVCNRLPSPRSSDPLQP